MMKKKGMLVVFVFAALVICGCDPKGVELRIRYDQVEGLKKGDRVIFQQNEIGKVTQIRYTEKADFGVNLVIAQEFRAAATEHSRFIIVQDPRDSGEKAVEIIQIRQGGRLLQNGEVVEGATRSSTVVEEYGDKLGESMKDLKDVFEKIVEGLRGVPESQEFKTLQKEFDQLLQDLKRSGKTAGEKFQKEVLPRLQKELEKLREQLKEYERETPPEKSPKEPPGDVQTL